MKPFIAKNGIVITDEWLHKVKDSIQEQIEKDEFKARTREPGFYKKLEEDLRKIKLGKS